MADPADQARVLAIVIADRFVQIINNLSLMVAGYLGHFEHSASQLIKVSGLFFRLAELLEVILCPLSAGPMRRLTVAFRVPAVRGLRSGSDGCLYLSSGTSYNPERSIALSSRVESGSRKVP